MASTEGSGHVSRGAFIVLEGLDRSGKTTQVKLLEERLTQAGKKVQVMRFPDRTTTIGKMIDSYLKSNTEMDDHVIHLLFSANRWEAAKTIEKTLAAGITIISDRYYHSGIVYSAAKQNPSLPLTWARSPERGLPRPDLVLFLDLTAAQAQTRGGFGEEVYEKEAMQKRVRELFWALSMGGKDAHAEEILGREEAGRLKEGGVWRQEEEDLVVVDAGGSVEDAKGEIWRRVEERVERVVKGELGAEVRRIQ
ncbi:thymidylate kinase [Sarocladium strictum]